MTSNMTGSAALVTGAASGIGAATAKLLAARGAQVLVVDFNGERAESVASHIRGAGHGAVAFRADASDPAQCEGAVEAALREFGRLDMAVNNVGIGSKAGVPAGEADPDEWDRVLRTTLSSAFYGMRYQIPAMLKSGGGAIINLSSITGVQGVVRNAAYVAAKHGVVGLTKAVALEYGPAGIRVNSVGPGYIDTPVYADRPPERMAALADRHALRRLGEAEEVANAIVFLLSEDASFITGSNHMVDGGYTAGFQVGAWTERPSETSRA